MLRRKWICLTIKNVILSYISHETITCDDRYPQWLNKDIKELPEKSGLQVIPSKWKQHTLSRHQFGFLQSKLHSLIKSWILKSKVNYYARLSKKISDTSPKFYWSILRTFLNNKKTRCIPPLSHDNKFIKNFKEKAELFSLINTNSDIPSFLSINPLSANPTKWPNTLKQFADKLFECVWSFCEISD